MNPTYYTTPEEVAKVVDYLNQNGIGGGVDHVYLLAFIGPFSVPPMEGKQVHQVVLANGTDMNAGLTLDLIQKYGPNSWLTKSMLEAMSRGR